MILPYTNKSLLQRRLIMRVTWVYIISGFAYIYAYIAANMIQWEDNSRLVIKSAVFQNLYGRRGVVGRTGGEVMGWEPQLPYHVILSTCRIHRILSSDCTTTTTDYCCSATKIPIQNNMNSIYAWFFSKTYYISKFPNNTKKQGTLLVILSI